MRLNIMEISWTDIEKLDKEKAAVFVGFAPIEEHGRHLPLGVDIFETAHWMNKTINLSQKLFYDLVLSTLHSIMEWGIKNIIIISGHADPKHTIAIEQVCEKIKKETGIILFAPMGAIFSKSIQIEDRERNKTKGFGHLGFPKGASEEYGIKLNKIAVEKIRSCTAAYLKRENYQEYEHHNLYWIPSLRVIEEE